MTDADYSNMMRVLRSIEAHLKNLNEAVSTLTVVTQEAGRVAAGMPASFAVGTPVVFRAEDHLPNATEK